MAAKYKSITTCLFRAFSQPLSFSGFVNSWKSGLTGAKPINSNMEYLIGSRCGIHTATPKEAGDFRDSGSMVFVKGFMDTDERNDQDFPQQPFNNEKSDIVHIKVLKNNTFVTITDSKGNKKAGASVGCLEELKAGGKATRFASEATAEHIGRMARNMGLKSVVMRVNGFTHFKKKKQAILSWKEGFGSGRGSKNAIAYIEDTTRRPHNGCRLRKKRRY